MMFGLFHRATDDEAELARRRTELETLRAALMAREADLAGLRAQLHSFEGRYIRQVGVLYVQLDDWQFRLAELSNPGNNSTGDSQQQPGPAEAERQEKRETPETFLFDLRSLFREVAKRIHPDFATSRRDEQQRTWLMAQANDALLRKDRTMLQRLLHGHDLPVQLSSAEAVAAEVARVLLLIQQIQADTESLDAELAAIHESEMAILQSRTIAAAHEGRDLLAEMAARVKGSIGIAMGQYEREMVRCRRKEAAFDPSPLLSAEKPIADRSAPRPSPGHRL